MCYAFSFKKNILVPKIMGENKAKECGYIT